MMKQDIRKLRKTLKEGEQEGEKRKTGWWNEECRKKKTEVRRKLRSWRRGKQQREVYMRARKEYKELWKEHGRNDGTDERNTEKGSRRGRILSSITYVHSFLGFFIWRFCIENVTGWNPCNP
ncbi:hypothetical protein K0M31_001948 [Melipona bicolor]|uniref:Uncharacterized protein n=1 Tax=Melipona bicolor TaxID=60889 RepID=A0AA40GGN1_9HYME|nr:hypothetical protein K0M31_001948 [Melipona bicolor]